MSKPDVTEKLASGNVSASVSGYPPVWDKMLATSVVAFTVVLFCGDQDGQLCRALWAAAVAAWGTRLWVKADNADFRRGDLNAPNNPQSDPPSPARTG